MAIGGTRLTAANLGRSQAGIPETSKWAEQRNSVGDPHNIS